MPYISASIILQLFGAVIPYFERLQKEGEEGRKRITQYTRYGTVAALDRAGPRDRHLPGEPERQFSVPVVPQPGHGLPAPDHPDHDRGHDLHHVARGEDHRARHRQRHLAHHLHRHRGPHARTRWSTPFSAVMQGAINPLVADRPGGGHGRRSPHGGGQLHPGPAQDPGAVRQADHGAQDVRRAHHAPARCASTPPASSRSSSRSRS